jgi:hypothetical protein
MARQLPSTVSNGEQTVINGRDARGRFLPGNAGGGRHVNPFGRYQRELRGALLAAVSPADLQAVIRKVLQLAKRGHGPSVDILLRYTLGGPPPALDPDRLDEHELSVKRGRPTLIDQLALADEQADREPANDEATTDEPEDDDPNDPRAPTSPPLRTVLAWAIEELAQAQTALRLQSPPPDPAQSWERFAASRLEWDETAAVDVDRLFVCYARWCASHGEPVWAEEPVLAWLTQHGATVHTGALTQTRTVQGVRVTA